MIENEHTSEGNEEQENPQDNENLVTVYTTSNHAIIAVIKSILDEAGIQYLAKGDNTQAVYAMNAFPVDFQVMPENETFARELLKDVEAGDFPKDSDVDDSAEEVKGDKS